MRPISLTHTKEELVASGIRFVKTADTPKKALRASAVLMYLNGSPVGDVAAAFGKCTKTIFEWVHAADTKGFGDIADDAHYGGPANKLPGELEPEAVSVLLDDPHDYGFGCWNGITFAEYLGQKYGASCSCDTARRIMRRNGFSLCRPHVRPNRGNGDDKKARSDYKKKLKAAKDRGDMIAYQDEVHFQQQTTVTRGWFPKGHAPCVFSCPDRQKAGYSGFVVPETGELVINESPWFNFEATLDSLRQFSAHVPDGRHATVAMDNAPRHRKAARLVREDAAYADIKAKLDILFLPPVPPRP